MLRLVPTACLLVGVVFIACGGGDDDGDNLGGGGQAGSSGAGRAGGGETDGGTAGVAGAAGGGETDGGAAGAAGGGGATDGGAAGVAGAAGGGGATTAECPLLAPNDNDTGCDGWQSCNYDPISLCLCTDLDFDSKCAAQDPRCEAATGTGGAGGFGARAYHCECSVSGGTWECLGWE